MQMKTGEWRTVCDHHLESPCTNCSYIPYAQGTALFMSSSLLGALATMSLKSPLNRPNTSDFTFQHRLCHDFESLIWVIVYAMMIHYRNYLATADPGVRELYKRCMDDCWAVHAYRNLLRSHSYMLLVGCTPEFRPMVNLWFPNPCEAAFFCEAMRLIRNQIQDGEPITYERLCALFRKHIQLATEPQALDVVPNNPY